MVLTSEELRKLSEKIVAYSNNGNQPKSVVNACRKAITAIAQLGAVLTKSEAQQLASTVGANPQASLPFNGQESNR